MELVEERVAPAPPPFRTHRAQFRQWAQDKAIHVATGRELEQRMADRNLRQRINPSHHIITVEYVRFVGWCGVCIPG
jgi:hypothetical protein